MVAPPPRLYGEEAGRLLTRAVQEAEGHLEIARPAAETADGMYAVEQVRCIQTVEQRDALADAE